MAKDRKLQVKESSIAFITQNETDFISLTDMTANFKEGSGLIGKEEPSHTKILLLILQCG